MLETSADADLEESIVRRLNKFGFFDAVISYSGVSLLYWHAEKALLCIDPVLKQVYFVRSEATPVDASWPRTFGNLLVAALNLKCPGWHDDIAWKYCRTPAIESQLVDGPAQNVCLVLNILQLAVYRHPAPWNIGFASAMRQTAIWISCVLAG